MSLPHANRNVLASTAFRPGRSVFRFLNSLLAVWRSRQALSQLDASRLEDVGLSDADVRRELEKPIWDVPQGWRR